MTAHRVLHDIYSANAQMPDPGDDANIIPDRSPCVVPIATSAAETRTVPDPTEAGRILVLAFKTDGGDCVITFDTAYTENGTTTLTLDEAGETVVLVSVPLGSAFVWRVVSVQGMAALTAADGGTVDTTYGQDEVDVITNLVTRVGEIEDRLQAAGLIQ